MRELVSNTGTHSVTLSIIIVNWNTRDLLAACLESVAAEIARMGEGEAETFVVDNASTDGSPEMVRERFPWVRLLESRQNLGFAAGNNLALQHARGESILLLNPDTIVTEGALVRLWQTLAAQPMAGITGAQLLNADGSLQVSTGVFPCLWSELPLINRRLSPLRGAFRVKTPHEETEVQSVDWVSGACLMIKRAVVEAIGPLDESFWLYTEETDWCYRARAAGWDVLLVPQARVYHLARAASGQRYVLTMLHFYQSKVRFVHKHYGARQASLLRAVLRMKAEIWRRQPGSSPLSRAYPDLSPADIRLAYEQLQHVLSLPLDLMLDARQP
ncbi:MAG: glycosyltransferase family 2 protein [Chloroflexota bacterium]|nr:glycosyltransferase family 2 protein [Chloroflexota bacterium]